MLQNFHSPNNWNPLMYAIRYANKELIDYFGSKEIKIRNPGVVMPYSLIHMAIFSGEVNILTYVLKNFKVSLNFSNYEISPLRIAIEACNS